MNSSAAAIHNVQLIILKKKSRTSAITINALTTEVHSIELKVDTNAKNGYTNGIGTGDILEAV